MQKVNCISKFRCNDVELTPRAKNIKTLHMIETKWGIRICCQSRIFTVITHKEGKWSNVKKDTLKFL